MKRGDYRRKAVLARIHTTLDSFYMRQEIDWNYDIRKLLDHILDLAMRELEFGEQGRTSGRGLIIVRPSDGEEFEVGAGWRLGEGDRQFSRTIVRETLHGGEPVHFENASHDPRFIDAESIKALEVVSVISVPVRAEARTLGAIYLENRDAAHIFTTDDLRFLEQFAETIAPYVKTALIHQEHVAAIRELKSVTESAATMPHILGRSQAMEKALELARIAASVERTVLITGESGCGKELLARAIHARSRRAQGKFVVVDCSSLTGSLLESELFGHVKGAFTGATHDKVGAFQEADGGTLFLDEICDAPKTMQQQLRRVLQEGEIRRVGSTEHLRVDVRVVCATNRNLPEEVERGRFIHDLYHRIHQFPIRLPPLRERREDIPLLVDHFLAGAGERKNPPVGAIEPEALARLVAREWRANNVRELRNVVELAVDLATGDTVTVETIQRTLEIREEADADVLATTAPRGEACAAPGDAQAAEAPAPAPSARRAKCARVAVDGPATQELLAHADPGAPKEERPYYRLLREFSGQVIVEALHHTDWKLRPAARLLGISPVKVRQDLRAYLGELLARAGDAPVDGAGVTPPPGGPAGSEASPPPGGDANSLATLLRVAPETLERKLRELGLIEDAAAPGSAP